MMRSFFAGLVFLMVLTGCASDQSESINGVSISEAPAALNRAFSDFDGVVNSINQSINRSLNDDGAAQPKPASAASPKKQ
ncbi:hypothetical protein [Bordetella avium]|nr:hypothetical protein [Bordetella avium]AZY50233.1 hypothetical protein C0J09_14680 [Bordetella avium]AZY53626.1 hypothetical protein C0J07_14930 [Bordetella avium]RIQ11631.1 hypothetical protein D0432_16125 [Bordetella avium]RIQ16218.1 hypothetical protein D0850_15660 [Bordetella avium]RIQ30926.1 hypothetical protein D0849_15380 [Bordetella avium]